MQMLYNSENYVVVQFDGSTWVDVARFVRGMDLQEPTRSREMDRFRPATCALTLDNRDGRFSPFNSASPYAPNVRPRRRCRVGIVRGATTLWRFVGWNEDWPEEHPESGMDNVVEVEFVDALALIAGVDGYERSPQGDGETIDQRVQRIMDNAGNPGGVVPTVRFTSGETMQATTLADNALTELYRTVDSIGGDMWVQAYSNPASEVLVWGRYARSVNSWSRDVQDTFTDDGTGLPYVDISFVSGTDAMVNRAAYARVGSTAQIAENTTSIAEYQLRQASRTDLVVQADSVVQSLANWAVLRFAEPEARIRSIEVDPQSDPSGLVGQSIWFTLLHDRHRVRRTAIGGYSIDQQVFVCGIRHRVTPEQWRTTYEYESTAVFDDLGDLMIVGTGLVVNDGKFFYP
jgi:hypothetical protein